MFVPFQSPRPQILIFPFTYLTTMCRQKYHKTYHQQEGSPPQNSNTNMRENMHNPICACNCSNPNFSIEESNENNENIGRGSIGLGNSVKTNRVDNIIANYSAKNLNNCLCAVVLKNGKPVVDGFNFPDRTICKNICSSTMAGLHAEVRTVSKLINLTTHRRDGSRFHQFYCGNRSMKSSCRFLRHFANI